ncbi:MAG: 30S ribosomal protein S3 [Candidatus Micrarchaeia archaeon]
MAIERKFIEDALTRFFITSYLKEKLAKVGFSKASIQRTPILTRISVEVADPGKLIGKKGRSIKKLTEIIEKEFGVKEPQIAVSPVEKFELDPQLMAMMVAKKIEKNRPIRPTIHLALKRIMDAGALGCEIRVSGKILAKGAKAKSIKVYAGYLPKAGDLTKVVKVGEYVARPKAGAINVRVLITPPGALPEELVKKFKLAKVYQYAEKESEASGEEK